MGSVIHGLSKVSPGPAMPNPSTPSARATPKMAKTANSDVEHPQGSQPAAIFFPSGHPTLCAYFSTGSSLNLLLQNVFDLQRLTARGVKGGRKQP
jgi:hypothetical protein